MKKLAQQVKAWIAEATGQSVMTIAYLALGLVLSIPYALLADGNLENVGASMFFVPIAAGIFYGLWSTRTHPNPHIPWWVGVAALVFLGWVSLPIFFHGLSIVLGWASLRTAGDFFFTYRYWSFLVVPVLAVVAIAAYARIKAHSSQFGGRATPPSIPPSSAGPPNKVVKRRWWRTWRGSPFVFEGRDVSRGPFRSGHSVAYDGKNLCVLLSSPPLPTTTCWACRSHGLRLSGIWSGQNPLVLVP